MFNDLFDGFHFIFQIEDGGFGIICADSKEAAVKDIIESYDRHGCHGLKSSEITITSIKEECQKPFKDSKNIVELGWKCALWE